MIWSFSDSRTFVKCQRQWYFKACVANGIAKDPFRHEAYLLSKLQSIAAWRGNIVDEVIGGWIVPSLKNRWRLNPARIIQEAKKIFNLQLEFARQHRLRENGISPTKAGEAFAAFYAVEYGLEISDKDIEQAWEDVELGMNNLLQMPSLITLLSKSTNLFPQRSLTFPHYQVTVKAVPDLIAFFNDRPPLIIDWKVHTFGTKDYRLQLACYAIALKRCKPHKDFPASLSRYSITDIGLLEVQLLTNQQREYILSNLDIEEVDTYIAESAMQMLLAKGRSENGQLIPFDFPVTNYPELCQRCSFRSLCWEETS